MTFQEVLAALQGMLGDEVKISVGAGDGSPAIVGTWAGRLVAGTETSAGLAHARDTLFFHLAKDAGSGFFLHGETFRGARWIVAETQANPILEIRSGPLALVVESTAKGSDQPG